MSRKPIPSPFLLRSLRSLTEPYPHYQHRLLLCKPHHHTPTLSRPLTISSHFSTPTPPAPVSRDRGPTSTEDTQTDFSAADIYSSTPAPTNSIDACLPDGFHLDNGVKITDGDGLLLVGGEAFAWRPWGRQKRAKMVNQRGQWEIPGEGGAIAWGLLGVVWPKPGECP